MQGKYRIFLKGVFPIIASMDSKPRPNHRQYLEMLARMTPEQRLLKAFQLSEMGKQLFLSGLRSRFPEKNEAEIKKIYLERILKCYNRNY